VQDYYKLGELSGRLAVKDGTVRAIKFLLSLLDIQT
jgi:hypothetical protein